MQFCGTKRAVPGRGGGGLNLQQFGGGGGGTAVDASLQIIANLELRGQWRCHCRKVCRKMTRKFAALAR